MNKPNSNELKREVGLLSAIALVVANMVGTGIFTTSGFIIEAVDTGEVLILAWVIGGVFSLAGALCYGELGARYPQAGGEYIYLRHIFGKPMAFLSGWISLIVGFSAPIAAAAIALTTYLYGAIGIHDATSLNGGCGEQSLICLSPRIWLSIGLVIGFSYIHYRSLSYGSRVQNVLTIFKVLLILIFVVAGLLSPNADMSHFGRGVFSDEVRVSDFAVALIYISFAYSGWNAAAYLGGEIKDPTRNIPLALFVGSTLVICLYIAINAVYILAMEPEEMAGKIDVGSYAATQLFGASAGRILSGAIAIGLLSVLSAMILTGPRVYYAMAKDNVFPRLFAQVNRGSHTPANAIWLQAAIAIAMIVTTTYDKLLIYIGFTLSLFSLFAVLGLLVVRVRNNESSRPALDQYRTWGYPATPLVFIGGQVWIIYYSLTAQQGPAIWGLMTIGIGVIFYVYFQRKARTGEASESQGIENDRIRTDG